MKLAVLQTDNLPYDKAKLSYFIQSAKKEGTRLFILPEYVLNRFFKELERMPVSFIKNQTNHQIKHLKKLSEIYNVTFIAPVVKIINNQKYKAIIKINHSVKYYYQQIYMPYPHWNEEKYFDKKESMPLIFNLERVKFGAMFGFEAHIEKFWQYFFNKKVDCVLIPSIGTFDSNKRWLEILKTKAFLNHCYVIRANRVGSFESWEFYGKSFGIDPEGEVIQMLGKKEEIGIVDINKNRIKEAKKEWKFKELEKSIKHF